MATTRKKRSGTSSGSGTQKSKEELRLEYKEKMARQRRRKKILFYIVFALVVAVVGIILSLTVFFKITTVEVEGQSQYTDSEIVEVSGINAGDNLFLVNKDKVIEHVSESLPFTGDIEVKRSFPNKIVINVTDSEVACAVKYDKGFVLINKDWKVLAEAKSIKEVNTVLKEQYDKRVALEEAAEKATASAEDTTASAEGTTASTAESTASAAESTTSTAGTTASAAESTASTAGTTASTADTTATTEDTTSTKNTIQISSTKIDTSVILITGLEVKDVVVGQQLVVSNQKMQETYQELMKTLEEYGIEDITAVDLSSASTITATYQNRIVLNLGSISGLEKKLQMAAVVIEQQDATSDELTGTIELSIEGRAYFSEGMEKTTKAKTTVGESETAVESTSGGTDNTVGTTAATSTTAEATGSINTTVAVN